MTAVSFTSDSDTDIVDLNMDVLAKVTSQSLKVFKPYSGFFFRKPLNNTISPLTYCFLCNIFYNRWLSVEIMQS